MKTNQIIFISVVIVLIITACGQTSTPIPTNTPMVLSREEKIVIFNTFFDALNEGDIEIAMSFVAEEATLCFERCVTGIEHIRLSIQAQIKNGYRHEVNISRVEGDYIYFFHRVYTGDRIIISGDDIMTISNGKIYKLKGV